MGGLATREVEELSDSSPALRTLTPKAVLTFALHGVFFDVTSDEIMDKSKANRIGKLLICVQVIGFAVQCIARAIAGYPSALLELHTAVHVVCALVMYSFWWQVRFAHIW